MTGAVDAEGQGQATRVAGQAGSPSERLSALVARDPQVRAAVPRPEVGEAARRPGLSYDKVIATFLEGYADRPALAERAYDVVPDAATGKRLRRHRQEFATISYAALHHRIRCLAMAWRTHPHCRVHRGEQVGVMGFVGIDYAVLDMACAYAKAVTVPLSGTLPASELRDTLRHVDPVLLAASVADLTACVDQAIGLPAVRSVLVFDHDPLVDAEAKALCCAAARLQENGGRIRLFLLDDLIAHGGGFGFSFLEQQDGENDRPAMIMHSSGSTGKPKGACITARALINTWAGEPKTIPRITVVMQPFHHNMGRNEMYDTLSSGGLAHFTLRPDMSTVFEDIRLARPVSLVFVPRVLEMVRQYYLAVAARRLHSSPGADQASVEAAVMSEMRAGFLGDRLLFGAVASAPLAAEVKRFIIDCFGIDLVDGYSSTETGSGGLALNGRINRKIVLDYKLASVPELGYFTTDKPHPRGELCVKTRFGIVAYYKQPEATARLFDDEGYCLTGDIVEELGPDHIAIIDRKANVVKLSQGEYVALGALAKLYETECPVVSQMYVQGGGKRFSLAAVVVPDLDVAKELLGGRVTEKALRQLIGNQLAEAARRRKLKSFELPEDFIIETERFTCANGLLSAVNKYLTPALRRKYGPRLEALHRERGHGPSGRVAAQEGAGNAPDVASGLAQILRTVLDRDIDDADTAKTFHDLGGDSLAAVLVSLHIQDVFGVHVGGDSILSPTGNLRQWVGLVANALARDGAPGSFEAVHGEAATSLHSASLRLEQFIDPAIVASAPSLPVADHPARNVVLTGANGFLGGALCLQWLTELVANGGNLVCIVRAPDARAARTRLEERFADKALRRRWLELASGRLEVLAGDIARPRLGLDARTFDRLAAETDRICHAGALVNHRLAYRHLFGPNVTGVAGAIHLALARRRKPIDFISTIGLGRLTAGDRTESAALSTTLELSDDYAGGYIASKWAGEHLLFEASRTAGIPVTIFRCDFILPPRRHGGEYNARDLLSRLVYTVLATGLAPDSFYRPGADRALRPHFGGVPLDILARLIVGSAHGNEQGVVVHHATNATQDVSLDTFMQWIMQAGYPLEITGHGDWLKQVAARLAAMPPERRGYSIAGMLDAFGEPLSPEPIPAWDNFRGLVERHGEGARPFLTRQYFLEFVRAVHQMASAVPCDVP